MFRRYLAAVRGRWWLLPIGVAVALVAAGAVNYVTPKSYQSTVRLITGQEQQGTDYNSIIAAQELAKTFAALVTTRPVMDKVIQELQLQTDAVTLARNVKVELIPETRLFDVTVNDNKPEQAAAIANAIGKQMELMTATGANAAGDNVKESAQRDINALQERTLQTEQDVAQLDLQITAARAAGTDIAELEARRATLQDSLLHMMEIRATLYATLLSASGNGVTAVAPAQVPTEPTTLGLGRTLAIAGLLGLILAIGLALGLDILDESVRLPEDLPSDERMPFLGSVPRFVTRKRRTNALVARLQPSSPAAESYRAVRTALRGIVQSAGPQTLLVTSSRPGEGKTTTAANLAVLFAQMGKRVVLVDADLRNPSLHLVFDMNNTVPGLSNALASDEASMSPNLRETGVEGLKLLTSGASVANTAELLASGRMEMVLMSMLGSADVVLFDTPPVLWVTDAAVLAPRADYVLLVVGAGQTSEEEVVRSREVLLKSGAALAGMVLTKTDKQLSRYYGTYGAQAPNGKAAGGRSQQSAAGAASTTEADGKYSVLRPR